MIISEKEENYFQKATSCHVCGENYKKSDIFVIDHYHVTGMYRESAHNSCNRSFKLTFKIPVIFHHLRVHDFHLIKQEIGNFNKILMSFVIIWYKAFMISDLVFIDSFQFMSSSLSELADNLSKESFHQVKNTLSSDALEFIIKKQYIPMIIWMVFGDSKRRSYRRKINSILN